MNRAFRKYHRVLALILCLPLLLTVITGMAVTLAEDWSVRFGITRGFLLKIHTGEIFHLEAFYPLLNGFGLIGLLITGLTMSGLFRKKPQKPSIDG